MSIAATAGARPTKLPVLRQRGHFFGMCATASECAHAQQGRVLLEVVKSEEHGKAAREAALKALGIDSSKPLLAPTEASKPAEAKVVAAKALYDFAPGADGDLGLKVEQRPVPWEEVKTLREVAACGTAVVLTPIKSITRGETKLTFDDFSTIAKLYEAVTTLQTADAPDPHGYLRVVCERAHESS